MGTSQVTAVVVGGGPTGLTSALALASAGFSVALVARQAPADNRTTALLTSSVAALETLGVWESCRQHAAPLAALRIVDATQRLWRAPEAHFDAHEIGLDAFAWNIENRHLIAALEARAAEMPNLHLIRNDAAAVDSHIDGVVIRTVGGDTIDAKLAVGADGKNSLCRDSRRHRRAKPELSSDRAHLQRHPQPSASQHLDRIPHRARPVHNRAAAGRSLQHRVRGQRSRRARPAIARRRSTRSRTRAPLAFDPRQDQSRRPVTAHFRW